MLSFEDSAAFNTDFIAELKSAWLPNLTDSALDRLIDMLEKGSPLLIHGCFSRSTSMGCLASHAAWHHPETAHLNQEAGIAWLNRVAGLNPATSKVIQAWDNRGSHDWEMRSELLNQLKNERTQRGERLEAPSVAEDFVSV
jgi:hypothetical protein